MRNFSSQIHDNDESNQQNNTLESPLNLTKSQSIWSPARSLENEANNYSLNRHFLFNSHLPNFTFGKGKKEPKEEPKIFPVSLEILIFKFNSNLI